MAVQVERDEPELRVAVAAAAEVSELRAARDAVGREHAAAMVAHEQESATLRAEHARSVYEQGVARAQLEADHEAHEADRRVLDGRVASLQQQVWGSSSSSRTLLPIYHPCLCCLSRWPSSSSRGKRAPRSSSSGGWASSASHDPEGGWAVGTRCSPTRTCTRAATLKRACATMVCMLPLRRLPSVP